ncbi:hypothetical protein ACR3K2_21050 [Cryptosporidium serpentis]
MNEDNFVPEVNISERDKDVSTYISTYHQRSSDGVKNKSPAPIQITMEQILRESLLHSQEIDEGRNLATTKYGSVELQHKDEIDDYRIKRRKEFEDAIRRKKWQIGIYLNYAKWEIIQEDYDRARSIFERALQIDYENTIIWRRYIHMEIVVGNINGARNLFERVTKLLPRQDEFWYRYCQMEEILCNYINTRYIYGKWIKWKPDDKAYLSYIKFEERCKEIDLARRVFIDYISSRPSEVAFILFGKFELLHNNLKGVKQVYQLTIEYLENNEELRVDFGAKLFLFFANIELNQSLFDNAIDILNKGLELIATPSERVALKEQLMSLHKIQTEERLDESSFWINEKSDMYMEAIKGNPLDYDTWFDYGIFATHYLDSNSILQLSKELIENPPPVNDAFVWEKFMYSCLLFANYLERSQNLDGAKEIFEKLVKWVGGTVMRKKMSYIDEERIKSSEIVLSVIYRYYAEFYIRQLDLQKARTILGQGLGKTSSPDLFRYYIDMEYKLGNLDRCRILYTKFIESNPLSAKIWSDFMEFEYKLEELDRAMKIAESGIAMPELDAPEILWKAYINILLEKKNLEKAKSIYERLLEKTQHPQVVIDYASFLTWKFNSVDLARNFLQNILQIYKQHELDHERCTILRFWLLLEEKIQVAGTHNTKENNIWVSKLKAIQPRIETQPSLKKENNYIEGNIIYIFPEDEFTDYKVQQDSESIQKRSAPFKLLDAAKRWKQSIGND